MNKRITARELSAYIDGEARNAEAVREAIEQSEEVADRHRALRNLSAQIRALPEPEFRPGFARRVVACLHDEMHQERPAALWRLPVGAALAAAAVVFVVVGTAVMNPTVSDPTTTIAMQPQPAAAAAPVLDEAGLLAELERRVAGDASVQAFVTARFDDPPQPAELYTEDLVLALFASEDFADAGQAFAAHGADYRPALRQLDDEQTSVLKELLADSVRQAHEG